MRIAHEDAARHNPDCLGCGPDNPATAGFVVTEVTDDGLRGRVTFRAIHQSAADRVHGGAIATVLDEALGRLAYLLTGDLVFTANLNVDFKSPASQGEGQVWAKLVSWDDRKLRVEGGLATGDRPVATATGLFIRSRAPSEGRA